jgi:dihydropyrimidine dehydrogenase (NAD+) subunit PreA
MAKQPNLNVNFCGVKFENPFLLSSSPVGNHAEMCLRAFEAGWGGIVYKTLNVDSTFKVIMPSPRLNAYNYEGNQMFGLQNAEQISDRGLKDNIKDIKLLKKKYPRRVLISSIMGLNDKDWALLAKMSEDAGADMLELNFSCPQMACEKGGHKVGQDYSAVEKYTAAVKSACNIPVIAKMTPNITDMIPVALAAKRGGADAISAINTIRAITDVDINQMISLPKIHNNAGITGFSGAAAKPVGLRFVAELYNSKELSLPVSAMGGVQTWRDALHYLLLGGTTIQVTTAIMKYGYRIVEDMIEGLTDYLVENHIHSLSDIIGKAAEKLISPTQFDTRYQVVSQISKEKCIGCGRCYISCFDAANQAIDFDLAARKAKVIEKRCVGCTLCKHICPVAGCITTKTVDTKKNKHAAIF